jgi:hypothetical protein
MRNLAEARVSAQLPLLSKHCQRQKSPYLAALWVYPTWRLWALRALAKYYFEDDHLKFSPILRGCAPPQTLEGVRSPLFSAPR